MDLIDQELVRTHLAERLGEAAEHRRAHRVARARRLSRQAERASRRARAAAARSL